MGTAVVDQRANSPAIRITGNAMVAGMHLDMTGFRECVMIEGQRECRPVIYNCKIRCSGDDAVNIGGQAVPVIHSCSIQVLSLPRTSQISPADMSVIVEKGSNQCLLDDYGK